MNLNPSYTHLVSYKRDEDDPVSTNIVHATSMSNIDRVFADCAWYQIRWVPEEHAKECRAKGMPERWV